MQKQSPFTIYNASAGSGKTFTLVKEYLKILFESKSRLAFRNSLALTFTNKAVGEMKERVIEMLKMFSEKHILETPNSMFEVLTEELNIEPQLLHERSKILLQTIIHNYAAFDISTIDKFNHKLIRTFAYDLKLPVNFEVELDVTTILGKAVDKLIDQTGDNEELTKVLVDFAIEKTDDDRSWDIARDLNDIAKLLVNENEIPFLDQLKGKTLSDFKALKTNLKKQQKEVEQQIIDLAKSTLDVIERNNLEFSDFSYKTLPNHFKKASDLNFDRLYNNNLQENLAERTKIYSKKLDAEKAITIDGLLPQIETNYLAIKRLVYTSKFLKNILKNITPLSVLSAIKQTLNDLKDEDGILLISEFNNIISKEIKGQPAPFIYERIGEKFKHYFIDEFQDTSGLQWHNLIPLIDNALSGENLKEEKGSLMLVGDAKQAIYRWRGGRAEQFIDLYSETKKPFTVDQNIKNLPTNYRSHKTIVEFNNQFFDHIAEFALSDPKHQYIYKNAKQNIFFNTEGYVELSFLNTKDEDKNELHSKAVFDTIVKAEAHGFKKKDICIIVRKRKEGVAIAEYLSDQGVAIISSETLLLKNAPEVQFINQLITLSLQPLNDEIKVQLLSFIAEDKLQLDDTHSFLEQMIHLKPKALFEVLNTLGFEFNFDLFLHLPIYEAVESVIRAFRLNERSNAYIQFYLDEVFDYSQKYNASFSGFLDYWDRKKDKLSIVSPLGKDAIQIMTIHKSKGLEFPVVIFPYANQDIYFELTSKVWYSVDETLFNGFSDLYINMNKDLEELNDSGAEIYSKHRSKLELDSLNLLYVVLTRAVEQLYIISEYNTTENKKDHPTHYSELFIDYLKFLGRWDDQKMVYNFGTAGTPSEDKKHNIQTIEQADFISTQKEDHNLNILTRSGYLWDTAQEKAIAQGNLVHHVMSLIKTENDVDFALEHFLSTGIINATQFEELKPIINDLITHKALRPYFATHLKVYNEKDIITKEGKLLRPDRVVINTNNQATIIDYKTGLKDSKHKEQLFDYQYVLEEMGFDVVKKVLIYINDGIVIKEF